MNHSPGPWDHTAVDLQNIRYRDVVSVRGPDGKPIFGICWHQDEDRIEANVRLVLAAPKLLAALQRIVAWHEKDEALIESLAEYEADNEKRFNADEVIYGPAREAIIEATGGKR